MKKQPKKFSSAQRSKARRFLLQALYQWQLSGLDPTEISKQFKAQDDFRSLDVAYFDGLLKAVTEQVTELDAALAPWMDRPMGEVNPVEKAVLRMAAYELMHRTDVPYPVVINEAVALTKKFGAEQAHTFVNSVLDKTAGELRALEKSCAQDVTT